MTEARRRARYEDLVDLPEGVTGQILDGELYTSPRPAVPHAVSGSELIGAIGPFMQRRGGGGRGGGPGGWHILYEPELHLGDDVLVPDLAGWRVERLPQLPRAPAIELPPDWLCEILSPGTARFDRIKKLPRYAQVGVTHVWLVDPLWRTLEVFRLQSGVYAAITQHEGEEKVRAEPFDVLEIDLADWWLPEDPAEDRPPG